MRKLRAGRDLLAGLLYILIGGLAVTIGSGYPLGSASRMGPGYFPVLVGALLVLVGCVVTTRGLKVNSERVGRLAVKALVLVLGSVIFFAATIEKIGLAAAILGVVVIGYLANARWRPVELCVLALVLTAASVLIFYYGLKLPFKVWPGPA